MEGHLHRTLLYALNSVVRVAKVGKKPEEFVLRDSRMPISSEDWDGSFVILHTVHVSTHHCSRVHLYIALLQYL